MTTLPEFMELNRNIILFLYGLVFFSLGIVLALQSRSYSRLDLARSLKWLAAFGIVHGIYEWADLFIPMQMSNLSDESIMFWMAVQLVCLAISYACLFTFGLSFYKTHRGLRYIPFAILMIWAAVVGGLLWFLPNKQDLWRNTGDALARHFLALPGGIIAAFGLRGYTMQQIAGLNVPRITWFLQLAGVSLLFYAFFGGLIVPPVTFFPGNILNNQVFVELFNVPPLLFRSIIGLILAIAMIRALEIFDIEYARRIEAMEKQKILAGERERIGRELHDNTLQTVYTAGLLVESTVDLAPPGSQMVGRLEHAVAALNRAIRDLRYSFTELQAESSNRQIKVAIRDMLEVEQFGFLIQINLSLDLQDTDELSPIRMDHVLSIMREAITNVVRHAHAQKISIKAFSDEHNLSISITDDGIGLPQTLSPGFGLRNMRDRTRLLAGEMDVHSESSKGTTVKLTIPLQEG